VVVIFIVSLQSRVWCAVWVAVQASGWVGGWNVGRSVCVVCAEKKWSVVQIKWDPPCETRVCVIWGVLGVRDTHTHDHSASKFASRSSTAAATSREGLADAPATVAILTGSL
jgi:hypothetical protein